MRSLEIGNLVPIFEAQDSKGKKIHPDLFSGYPFVIYFYPRNETPGCTTEACSFRDIQNQLDQLNVHIIGISPDSNDSHNRFIAKHHLRFSLISDPYYELCSLFGVWEEKKAFGQTKWGVTRSTFIVDGKNVIRWIEKPVRVEGHAQRVLQAIQHLPHASES